MALIGVVPEALTTWQRLTTLSVPFHHANVRLPLAIERWLARLVMTPRLHGIHHSIVREEQDSNWSSGLALSDRLHGTCQADVPQDAPAVEVPLHPMPENLAFPRWMAMPLHPLDAWRLPDGTPPVREPRARGRRTSALTAAHGRPGRAEGATAGLGAPSPGR